MESSTIIEEVQSAENVHTKNKPSNHENSNQETISLQILIPISLAFLYVFIISTISSEWPQNIATFYQCSILTPLISSLLYLAVIHFGKKFMENRKPFEISEYMLTYNIFQTLFNFWVVISIVNEMIKHGYPILGNQPQDTSYQISFLIWLHYNNKYLELLDTLFMVLRKKNVQISFLHVYHHVLLIWSWWAVCILGPGGDGYFGAMVNSFVHVVMYGYYSLALLKIPCPWKPLITQIQLTQFVLCFFAAIISIGLGFSPVFLPLLQIFVMINMFVLFLDFYRKAYGQNRPIKE